MEVVREARGYVKTYGVKVNATASVIAQFDLHYRYREYAYESNTQSSNDVVIHDADKEMRNSYKVFRCQSSRPEARCGVFLINI